MKENQIKIITKIITKIKTKIKIKIKMNIKMNIKKKLKLLPTEVDDIQAKAVKVTGAIETSKEK